MHRPLKCGSEPLKEICNSFTNKGFDVKRVAFFKELGRAAYSNPINENDGYVMGEENGRTRSLAETAAGSIREGVYEVRQCPVCGVSSLVIYEDGDHNLDDDGNQTSRWWKTFSVKCECCGVRIDDDLGNPAEYGTNIPDFWESKEWPAA